MAKAKRMEGLDISQVAGVDHPAHLEEGWMVMKAVGTDLSADAASAIVAASFIAKAGRKLSGSRLARLRQTAEDLAGLIAEVDLEEQPVGELTKSTDAKPDEGAGDGKDDKGATTKAATTSTDTPTAATDTGAASEDEMMKSLPESLRKRFIDMEAQVASTTEALAKSQASAAIAVEVQKAAGWRNLPGTTPDALGPALYEVAAKTSPETASVIAKALDDANTAIGAGSLFKELGRAGTGEVGGDNAYGRLEAMAKARATEKSEHFSVAFDAITQTPEGKALFDQYNAEKREARA